MPNWIRVRDDITGDEYDVHERSLRPGFTPIGDYPPNTGPGARPRPAKIAVAKDGTRAAPKPTAADELVDEPMTAPAVPPADNTEEQ